MKRVLILVAISLFLGTTTVAFQGGGGESTKKGSSKNKEATKKKPSGTKPANTTPPRPPAPVTTPSTSSATATTSIAPASAAETVEALVLMHECFTPCSATLGVWRFKIRTEGRPLQIKFQGVRDWFMQPGEGVVQAPPGIEVGETQFVSPDETHPHTRVQVYRKIVIKKALVGSPSTVDDPIEALVLEHECYTPCTMNVGWREKIRTDGRALRVRFSGKVEWFDLPGEKEVSIPLEKFDVGDAQFASPDETHPNVLVQVYKKIFVPRSAVRP